MQSKLGGTKQTLLTVAFNSVNHAFWRIRHDAVSGQVVFETASASGSAPGTWLPMTSAIWNTPAVPLSSVSFELKGGTWQSWKSTTRGRSRSIASKPPDLKKSASAVISRPVQQLLPLATKASPTEDCYERRQTRLIRILNTRLTRTHLHHRSERGDVCPPRFRKW